MVGDPIDVLINESSTLRGQIRRHVLRNPGDWSTEDLFGELGAFEAGDAPVHPVPGGPGLRRRHPRRAHPAARRRDHKRAPAACGGRDAADGHRRRVPAVQRGVRTVRAGPRQPEDLIFASPRKPDIRFASAVDNDIEIVTNADQVLVYDRPIGPGGLRWRDLQEWWQETRAVADEDDAKRSLYRALAGSLPASSPPQRNLFDLYHEIHGSAVPDLPALLPEVWLHWDPKTVQQRGRAALLRFRMDFLLLLPRGERIVLEVDGAHHYATADGARPDPARYADEMRGDRELKLAGYEVFRFGATELQDRDQARALLREFFADLFRRFGVGLRPA